MNMPVMKTAWLICLVLATAVCAAQDRTCRDISFPGHVQVNGNDLRLNGLGVRKATFLKINVYVAALYVVQPVHDPKELVESDAPQQLVPIAPNDDRMGRSVDYAFSTSPPASSQPLKPPRFCTLAYPISLRVLPTSAERPPDAQ